MDDKKFRRIFLRNVDKHKLRDCRSEDCINKQIEKSLEFNNDLLKTYKRAKVVKLDKNLEVKSTKVMVLKKVKEVKRSISNCKGLLKDGWFASTLWTQVLYSDDPFYREYFGISEEERWELREKEHNF